MFCLFHNKKTHKPESSSIYTKYICKYNYTTKTKPYILDVASQHAQTTNFGGLNAKKKRKFSK